LNSTAATKAGNLSLFTGMEYQVKRIKAVDVINSRKGIANTVQVMIGCNVCPFCPRGGRFGSIQKDPLARYDLIAGVLLLSNVLRNFIVSRNVIAKYQNTADNAKGNTANISLKPKGRVPPNGV
jgi:hypothetical protein